MSLSKTLLSAQFSSTLHYDFWTKPPCNSAPPLAGFQDILVILQAEGYFPNSCLAKVLSFG